jgi:hypothetical protein
MRCLVKARLITQLRAVVKWVQNKVGMTISRGNPERYSEEILLKYHFLHHESHMKSHGTEPHAAW